MFAEFYIENVIQKEIENYCDDSVNRIKYNF